MIKSESLFSSKVVDFYIPHGMQTDERWGKNYALSRTIFDGGIWLLPFALYIVS
jgi:hypothetical protein